MKLYLKCSSKRQFRKIELPFFSKNIYIFQSTYNFRKFAVRFGVLLISNTQLIQKIC
jgi:hypothetical protein